MSIDFGLESCIDKMVQGLVLSDYSELQIISRVTEYCSRAGTLPLAFPTFSPPASPSPPSPAPVREWIQLWLNGQLILLTESRILIHQHEDILAYHTALHQQRFQKKNIS